MEQTHAFASFGPIVPPAQRQALFTSASVPALWLGFEGLEPWEAYPSFDLAAFTGQTAKIDPERDTQATIRKLKKVIAELKASLPVRG